MHTARERCEEATAGQTGAHGVFWVPWATVGLLSTSLLCAEGQRCALGSLNASIFPQHPPSPAAGTYRRSKDGQEPLLPVPGAL